MRPGVCGELKMDGNVCGVCNVRLKIEWTPGRAINTMGSYGLWLLDRKSPSYLLLHHHHKHRQYTPSMAHPQCHGGPVHLVHTPRPPHTANSQWSLRAEPPGVQTRRDLTRGPELSSPESSLPASPTLQYFNRDSGDEAGVLLPSQIPPKLPQTPPHNPPPRRRRGSGRRPHHLHHLHPTPAPIAITWTAKSPHLTAELEYWRQKQYFLLEEYQNLLVFVHLLGHITTHDLGVESRLHRRRVVAIERLISALVFMEEEVVE